MTRLRKHSEGTSRRKLPLCSLSRRTLKGSRQMLTQSRKKGKKRRDLRRTSCLRPVPRRKGSRSRHRKGKCLVRRTLCGGLHPRINRFLPSTHFNHSPGSPDLNRGPARHMSTRAMPSPDRNSLSIHHSQASRMQHSRARDVYKRQPDDLAGWGHPPTRWNRPFFPFS